MIVFCHRKQTITLLLASQCVTIDRQHQTTSESPIIFVNIGYSFTNYSV